MISRRSIFGVLLGAPVGALAAKADFVEKDALHLEGKKVMAFVDGHLRISPDLHTESNSVMSLTDLNVSENEDALMWLSKNIQEIK